MYNAVSNPVDKKVLYGTVKNFVTAYNRAGTYASDQVLERCYDLTQGIVNSSTPKVSLPSGTQVELRHLLFSS